MIVERVGYSFLEPSPIMPTVSQDGTVATYFASYILVNTGSFIACNCLQGNHEFSWHFFLDGPPREVPWTDLTDNQRLRFRIAFNEVWWPHLEELGFLYDDGNYYELEELLAALESL